MEISREETFFFGDIGLPGFASGDFGCLALLKSFLGIRLYFFEVSLANPSVVGDKRGTETGVVLLLRSVTFMASLNQSVLFALFFW